MKKKSSQLGRKKGGKEGGIRKKDSLSNDSDVSNDLDGSGSKHVVLVVRKRLRGSDDDGVSSVGSERIEVLHVAADDGVLKRGRDEDQKTLISLASLFPSLLPSSSPHRLFEAKKKRLTSAASRTTSYSTSFHPLSDFSMRT